MSDLCGKQTPVQSHAVRLPHSSHDQSMLRKARVVRRHDCVTIFAAQSAAVSQAFQRAMAPHLVKGDCSSG